MVGTSWRRRAGAVISAAMAVSLVAACGGGGGQASPGGGESPDSGAKLTMWARNTSDNLAKVIVDEYNKTHKNQIELTTIPNDTYQQKVAAAAASKSLPDIVASDVVYSPNYVKQGLFRDVTDRVKGLSFYSNLSKAHMEAASADGKIYGTPFILDSSLIFYNKTLFKKAGLDPTRGPANFDEIYKDAKAVRDAVGGDTYGFYFGGNCPGCNAYTMFGYLAAAGKPPFTNDGKTADFDTPAMKATLDLYKKLWDDGLVAPSAKTEDGANWVTLFNQGKIGILPRGTSNFAKLKDAKFEWGVVPLPAPDGSASAGFVGGDVAAISSTSKHVEQAWNFLEWTLGEDAQVGVIAKAGSLPSRVDLAENQYSKVNPSVVAAIKGLANGYTPSTIGYGNAINNTNGPWLKMVRDYVFNGNPNAVSEGQKAIQASIDQTQ
jgi:multiple sugar transport system substrate-binding protein